MWRSDLRKSRESRELWTNIDTLAFGFRTCDEAPFLLAVSGCWCMSVMLMTGMSPVMEGGCSGVLLMAEASASAHVLMVTATLGREIT